MDSTSKHPHIDGSEPPKPARSDPYVGKTIEGKYIVERLLGEGGMGFVYRARHKIIDKRVALKILKTDASREKEMAERFVQEAKSASSIGHPHIVDITDFGSMPDGAAFFVMEYLDGSSLSALLEEHKDRGVPVPRVIHLAKQLAQGLGAAHAAGVVHRDLKPDNVMLVTRGSDKDFVKILDFGIAKAVGETTSRITKAGTVFGTPHYMSPEQAAGTPVDQRTDIYSLGVILYEMASGRVPFDADNFMGILTQHMYRAPVSMLALVPPPDGVPPGLDAIVRKCLSKKPEQRYASMEELVGDLTRLEKGDVPNAVPDLMSRSGSYNVPQDYYRGRSSAMPEPLPATPRGVPRRTRWPLVLVIGGVIGAAAAAVAVVVVTSRGSARARPEPIVLSAVAPPATTSEPAPLPTPAATIELDSPRQVAIATDPSDAKLFLGEAPLEGTAPFFVPVKPGEKVELVAKRAGYKDMPVLVDGTQDRMLVKLVLMGTRPAKPAASAPAKPATPKKPCDITDRNCDPWAK
jgi:eukaryotic-like serine/threonine-protein kinase